jgi:hypothetical protein
MYEQIRDEKLPITDNITKLVLEAKLNNQPFAVLKGGVKNVFTKEHFDKYNEHIKNDYYSGTYRSRAVIKDEDLNFFPMWYQIQKALIKIYGNPTQPYNSIMQTGEHAIGKVHASLHRDRSDVVHLCCYGTVEWLLVDVEKKEEHRITMEPGDVLYMRGYTLHETVPRSHRGSLVFMNLPLEEFPEIDPKTFKTEEELEEFKRKQRLQFLDDLEKGI